MEVPMAVAVAVSDQSAHHLEAVQVAQLVHSPVAQFIPSAPPREEPTGTFSRRSASASVEVRGGGARQHRGVLVLIAAAAVATAFLLLATLLPTDTGHRGRRPPATGSFDKACRLPKFAPPPGVAPDGGAYRQFFVAKRRSGAWRATVDLLHDADQDEDTAVYSFTTGCVNPRTTDFQLQYNPFHTATGHTVGKYEGDGGSNDGSWGLVVKDCTGKVVVRLKEEDTSKRQGAQAVIMMQMRDDAAALLGTVRVDLEDSYNIARSDKGRAPKSISVLESTNGRTMSYAEHTDPLISEGVWNIFLGTLASSSSASNKTAGGTGPSGGTCIVSLFREKHYRGLVRVLNATRRMVTTFNLSSAQKKAVKSVKMAGDCLSIVVWDDDACKRDSDDNKMYMQDVPQLPYDLSEDVCKITVHLRPKPTVGGLVSPLVDPRVVSAIAAYATWNEVDGPGFGGVCSWFSWIVYLAVFCVIVSCAVWCSTELGGCCG